MQTQIQLAAAITSVLSAAVAATTLAPATIHAMGGTTAAVTPSIGVVIGDYASEHPGLHRGIVDLILEVDADTTSATTAAAQITAAAEYLTSSTGRGLLETALAPSGIWLRILNIYPSPANMEATEERTLKITLPLSFWIQTIL